MTAIVMMVLVLVVAVFVAGAGKNTVDLRQERGHLPFRFRAVATAAPALVRERGWITHQAFADAGADGVDDLFRANDHGICGSPWSPAGPGRDWQTNLPVMFARKGPCASIDGVWDVDGDGRAEVVCTARTADGFHWRLDVLDAATGERKWHVELPAGSDDRGDGNWDGFFRAIGPFTARVAEGARPALLVGIEAGHDERPRGVLALDARDGRELWRHLIGAKPIVVDFHIVDLEGDDHQEIILLGAGVSNLEEGEEVAGFSDDHARLFVLGDDGALRWQRALGEAPASGWVKPVDVDGDGRFELVITAHLAETGSESLFVLEADGALLASAALPSVCHGLEVAAQAGGATAWLSFDGAARRYAITRAGITAEAAAVLDGPAQVALVADVVGDAAHEVVLGAAAGRTWLLDDALQPLALLDDPGYRALKSATALRRLAEASRRVVVLGDEAHASAEFLVEENPRGVPWALIMVGVAGVGAAGAVWRWRGPKELTPEAIRAMRMQVMDHLEMAGHGRIGSLTGVESLTRYVGSHEAGLIDAATLQAHTAILGPRLLETAMPNLASAAEIAALARLDADTVRSAQEALVRLRLAVEAALSEDDPTAPREGEFSRADALEAARSAANAAFRRLRACAEEDFSAAPDPVIAAVLDAHADDIARLGVTVLRPPAPAPACIVDNEDLTITVDNLVENALRAMATAPTRRLVIAWQPDGKSIAISVQDSGLGMTAAEAKAALEPGPGKRAEGGRGLPACQELLRKYGASLSVGASAPGQGTTMILQLRKSTRAMSPAS